MCQKTNGAMICPLLRRAGAGSAGRGGLSGRAVCPFQLLRQQQRQLCPHRLAGGEPLQRDGTTGADSLYNPTTGEELTGYQQYTGAGTVSLYNNDRYQLVDLVSTEQSAVLCEYDQPIRYYVPGAAVTEPDASTPEMAGRYLFHDLLTGEEKDLYDAIRMMPRWPSMP